MSDLPFLTIGHILIVPKNNDPIHHYESGKPLSLGNFHNFWVKTLDKSGARYIRFHDLRHTCASLLLSAGTHPKIVQEMLGYSSIKVTLDLYSHMTPNLQSDAVKALEQMLK
ncbi:tyrosine-type recombinase/integrase [Brevibacillus laterosporus]|uniref:Tyrosine-type recombinase/integrase n=1 Tax=Brevibacillus laterosporus TaxID=1465 RepID=A0AAP3G8R0_BRELA|nr:tyrosine-type recombinase/integrase [Brevibacillus laterosporus]MCR8980566.1 tyrosine-type recombinase/integrase [Brevibacillus laterosporus]MCZ0807721.1 tyrosine-type recombinase/integrase [Brevibacillus laterosporus]MCZ0826986.1 tyrosine-type recombinase/integrase [Brevibacillus laterosporus]MCZ0851149.1 tyrosine-type recombinase/integrase [Brevibacillus laterosporus]